MNFFKKAFFNKGAKEEGQNSFRFSPRGERIYSKKINNSYLHSKNMPILEVKRSLFENGF